MPSNNILNVTHWNYTYLAEIVLAQYIPFLFLHVDSICHRRVELRRRSSLWEQK